ncbi:unnamed protein product [Trichogramma brassicae]|uniref:Uncharacterized protein n=1 Tax=Trichogramma brassicae TaxID=86971 RepID=A0A6H5HXZ6_9HYME|nr:unnamed protein product [Trichogramma brassicae]
MAAQALVKGARESLQRRASRTRRKPFAKMADDERRHALMLNGNDDQAERATMTQRNVCFERHKMADSMSQYAKNGTTAKDARRYEVDWWQLLQEEHQRREIACLRILNVPMRTCAASFATLPHEKIEEKFSGKSEILRVNYWSRAVYLSKSCVRISIAMSGISQDIVQGAGDTCNAAIDPSLGDSNPTATVESSSSPAVRYSAYNE